MSSPTPIRILLVEDDEDDAFITQQMLRDAGARRYEIRWVATYAEARSAILAGDYDVALVDYRLGGRNGLDLIREADAAGVARPFLLLTGEGGDLIDDAALEAGAMDFLTKADVTPAVLERSIRYSIRSKEREDRLRRREAELRALVAGSPDVISRYDRELRHLFISPAAEQLAGFAVEHFIGRTSEELGMPPALCARWAAAMHRCFATAEVQELEFELETPDGPRAFHTRYVPEHGPDGSVATLLGISRDITTLRDAARENLRLAAAFENLSVGIVITDPSLPENPIVYANAGFRALTGYDAHETLGRNCRFLQAPDTDAGVVDELRRAIAERRAFSGTLLNVRKDGTPFWNELVVSPVFDAAGSLVNFVGIQTDVTEQREAESRLRVAKQLLESFVNTIPDQAWVKDRSGRYELVNDAFVRSFALPRSEVVGRTDAEIFTADVARRYGATDAAALAEGTVTFEESITTPAGEARWYAVTKSRIPGGSGTVGIVHDITERRHAEERLRRSEEYFRSLIEHGGDLIALVDAEDRIRFLSPSVGRLLGYEAGEMLGTSIAALIHPDDLPRVREVLGELVGRPGVSMSAEYRIRHRDGSYRFHEAVGVSRLADPTTAGIVVTARDVTERKHAEAEREALIERLRVERSRMAEAFELAPSFFAAVRGADHVFELMNPAYCALVGRHDLIGRRVADALPEVVEQGLVGLLDRVLATGEPFIAEELPILLRRREGAPAEERVVSFVYQALTEADGTRSGVFVHGVDVTEQVAARRAAERSAAEARLNLLRLEAVLAALPVGVFIADRTGNIELTNPAAARIWGGTAPLVSREEYGEYRGWKPETGEPIAAEEWPIARAILTGTDVLEMELEIEGFDGVHRTVLASGVLVRDPAGEVLGVIAVNVEITDRKRAETELHAANETLRTLIEAMPLAVCTLDAQRRVTMWNPAAERMYGWAESEVVGGAYPLVPADREDEHLRLMHSVFEEGQVLTGFETVRLRRDGRPVQVSISNAPLRGATGAVRAMLTVHADITERRQLEDQLHHAQRLESVGRLAGGVAHDFNNLLMVIDGAAQLMLEDIDEGAPAWEDLGQIQAAAKRAADLTRQLLAFSRKQVLAPQVLDLNDVVAGTERMLRRVIGEDVELITILDPAIGRVEADPGQVDQVLMNLAVNARDAMPQGGTLVIATTNVAITPQQAQTHPYRVVPGDYVALMVEDTGTGMDAGTLSQIFEPFFSTKGQLGTGLGLATVYGIVKQSGGYIWAAIILGGGTTFHVYLPRVESRAAADAAAPLPRFYGGGQRVLVVEDEPAVLKVMERVLGRRGYNVLTAGGGHDALEIAECLDGRIDLLVTDVIMPKMSGRELIERFRERWPEVPVLFMSGYTDDAVVLHGVRAAEVHFLQKPIHPDALLEKVSAILSGGAP